MYFALLLCFELLMHNANCSLYTPGDIVSDPDMISTQYIDDCLEQKKLLNVEQYRLAANIT